MYDSTTGCFAIWQKPYLIYLPKQSDPNIVLMTGCQISFLSFWHAINWGHNFKKKNVILVMCFFLEGLRQRLLEPLLELNSYALNMWYIILLFLPPWFETIATRRKSILCCLCFLCISLLVNILIMSSQIKMDMRGEE